MTYHRGFTLLELLVVLAIVGILAAVAYPSYQDSVRQANRLPMLLRSCKEYLQLRSDISSQTANTQQHCPALALRQILMLLMSTTSQQGIVMRPIMTQLYALK